MGAPGTPAEILAPPGRQIREAREKKLKISADAFGQLLNYDGSHIRSIELGRSGHHRLAERCAYMAGNCKTEPTAKVLADLAEFLNGFTPEDSEKGREKSRGREKGRGKKSRDSRKERRRQRDRAKNSQSKKVDRFRGLEAKADQEQTVEQLLGLWHAIWQTSRHRREALVVETVLISPSSRGREVRMANRSDSCWLRVDQSEGAGKLGEAERFPQWSGIGRITKDGRWVNGEFSAVSQANVEGVFRLRLGGLSEALVGDWVGESWDSEKTHGLLVLGRTRALAESRFANERGGDPCLPHSPT